MMMRVSLVLVGWRIASRAGAVLLALAGYWLCGIPIAYLAGFTFGLRGVGVWIGLAAGLAAVAIVLTYRFSLRRKHFPFVTVAVG